MKKNNHLVALACLTAGLVLAACTVDDGDVTDQQQEPYVPLPVDCSYEAQWQVDREVIDTATFSVAARGNIQVSRVPTDWLLANFMPDDGSNGVFQSSEPLLLDFQVVGYSGQNSYFTTMGAAPSQAEPTEVEITLTDVRQLFAAESNAAGASCSVAAYWSPMQSGGVYDSQRDAWTVAFSVDSVVVERVVAASGSPSAGDRQTVRSVERFSPALRLNLVTTKRKE